MKIKNLKLKIEFGFTLIEVLVAVTIIAVLAAVAITSYSGITKSSRDARRKADMEQVRSALEVYRSQVGYYPDPGTTGYVELSDADLVAALVTDYIQAMPVDPLPSVHPDYLPYKYKVVNQALDNNYYGYCLEANLEGTSNSQSTTQCTPEAGYSNPYVLQNP